MTHDTLFLIRNSMIIISNDNDDEYININIIIIIIRIITIRTINLSHFVPIV